MYIESVAVWHGLRERDSEILDLSYTRCKKLRIESVQ